MSYQMECPNCGVKIEEVNNKNFCELCGFDLNLKANTRIESTRLDNPVKISRRRCC